MEQLRIDPEGFSAVPHIVPDPSPFLIQSSGAPGARLLIKGNQDSTLLCPRADNSDIRRKAGIQISNFPVWNEGQLHSSRVTQKTNPLDA